MNVHVILLLTYSVIVASAGQASADEASLWGKYVQPTAAVPADARVTLLTGARVVKGVEGFGPSIASLASLFEYAFPPRTVADRLYTGMPSVLETVGSLAGAIRGRPLGPRESRKLYDSALRGRVKQAVDQDLAAYYEAARLADSIVEERASSLRSPGQRRMALLRAIADKTGHQDNAVDLLDDVLRIRCLRCLRVESRPVSIASIHADLGRRRPALLVTKSGQAVFVLGAISDKENHYVIFADTMQVEQRIQMGLASRPDIESKDPTVRRLAESMAAEQYVLDYEFVPGGELPRGIRIAPFQVDGYDRWISYAEWKNDVNKFSHVREAVTQETRIMGEGTGDD